MDYPIRILSDIRGQIVAVVDVEGTEYTVQMNSIGVPTVERNELIRKLAKKKEEAERAANIQWDMASGKDYSVELKRLI